MMFLVLHLPKVKPVPNALQRVWEMRLQMLHLQNGWRRVQETFHNDPVAEKIKAALSSLVHDKAFRLAAKDTISKIKG